EEEAPAAAESQRKPPDGGEEPSPAPAPARLYRVQVGVFKSRDNAVSLMNELKEKYQLEVYVKEIDLDGETRYRVQVGAFSSEENAEKLSRELRMKGHRTFISRE
ncbi:MAG: SPOR domain-containing protein, partial [bacterium]